MDGLVDAQNYIQEALHKALASTSRSGRACRIPPISQFSFLNCCIICHLRERKWSTERQNDGAIRVAFPSRIIIVIIG